MTQLAAGDLERFKVAMTAFKARADNKGYEYFANWHGVAFGLCQHHNDLFLPWHRGYLYHYELALQDIDPDVTVPWWNWMDEAGLPTAFTDSVDANPLTGAQIEPSGVPRQPGWPKETTRDPGGADGQGPAPLPPPLRTTNMGGREVDLYSWMMNATAYADFESRCWRLHDNIHVWVGGTMSDQNWAAYDPIFWTHHAMVDRLWRLWQANNPSALPDPALLGVSMSFATWPSLKVADVIDVTQLGYDYAAQVAASGGTQ